MVRENRGRPSLFFSLSLNFFSTPREKYFFPNPRLRTLFIQQNETKRKFTGVSNRVCKKKKKKNDRDKFKRI